MYSVLTHSMTVDVLLLYCATSARTGCRAALQGTGEPVDRWSKLSKVKDSVESLSSPKAPLFRVPLRRTMVLLIKPGTMGRRSVIDERRGEIIIIV